MKVSDITASKVAEYLRLDSYDAAEITPIIAASRAYIRAETALSDAEIDEHEDLTIAALILCQEMYDNRAYTNADAGAAGPHANLVVETILNFHRQNLV